MRAVVVVVDVEVAVVDVFDVYVEVANVVVVVAVIIIATAAHPLALSTATNRCRHRLSSNLLAIVVIVAAHDANTRGMRGVLRLSISITTKVLITTTVATRTR